MDDEIEGLVVGVRADTAGFARDVAAMRGALESGLGEGAERAGRRIEGALLGAARSGRFGFEDLRRTALAAIDDIAAAAINSGLGSIGLGPRSGGIAGFAGGLLAALLGAPGRATGGPVSPGRAYRVGERGPEVFVPTASGRVEAAGPSAAPREVKVAITINAPAGSEAAAMARSGRQVARAVRTALERA